MPRFSLKTLLIAAAVVPVATYGFVQANPFTTKIVVSVSVVAWIVAAIMASEGMGEIRAFARGIAIASLAFAVVTWSTGSVYGNAHLFSYDLLLIAHKRVFVNADLSTSPTVQEFLLVGQVYWCAVVGLIGGWFAVCLYRRRIRQPQSRTEASAP
jgi:membrane associated rhomboid family serine protease